MEHNIFLQECLKLIWYLYLLKSILNILVILVGLIGGNLTECQKKNIENITKSDNNFAPTFVNHDSLPDINFNGHCLINNVYILIKVITQPHG